MEDGKLDQVSLLAAKASKFLEDAREQLLAPMKAKVAPHHSAQAVASYAGVSFPALRRRLAKGDLPKGEQNDSGHRKFTTAEAQEIVRALRPDRLKPKGKKAVTLSAALFKGGVGKTTLAMCLAQALTLRGHKVLFIDADPQGSGTTLFGLNPALEVEEAQTILPMCEGVDPAARDLSYAVRKDLYWPNLHLVSCSPAVFGVEFFIAKRAMDNQDDVNFWRIFDRGLDKLRDEYDVIVIDTPPSLSYVTVNALFASQGIVLPIVPNMLDLASAAEFWSLLSDFQRAFVSRSSEAHHEFDFIHMVLNKVNSQDPSTQAVSGMINEAYGKVVAPIQIPASSVTSSTAITFGTPYDVTKYGGSREAYTRARSAYDALANLVDNSIYKVWNPEKATRPEVPLVDPNSRVILDETGIAA